MIPINSRLLLHLHQIGFVVANIRDSAPGFVRSLGASWVEVLLADLDQKIKVTFLKLVPRDVLVELVESNAEDATVDKRFVASGTGIYHLYYVYYEVNCWKKPLRNRNRRVHCLPSRPLPSTANGSPGCLPPRNWRWSCSKLKRANVRIVPRREKYFAGLLHSQDKT